MENISSESGITRYGDNSPQMGEFFKLFSREITLLTISESLPFSFCEKMTFKIFASNVLSCKDKPEPQKAIIEECAKLVAAENFSFRFGEGPQVVDFLRFLHPGAEPVPGKTLVQEMKRFYQKEKKDLIATFSNLESRVSVSVDFWADAWKNNNYLCLSCHWIDGIWKLQKRVFHFESFYDKDSAGEIFGRINERLNEYGLSGKVSSIGFDNACLKMASLDLLRNVCEPGKIQFFHGRYASHVLNVAAQEVLTMLDEFISPVTKALQRLFHGRENGLLGKWFKFCKLHGREKIRFQSWHPKWHYTYILLSEASEYSTLLCSFFVSNLPDCEMNEIQWSVCKKIVKVFSVMRRMILILSSVYTPTSNRFIIEACNLVGVLHEFRNDEHLKVPVTSILIEWLTCYRIIPPAFLVAAVFDPRVKLHSLRSFLDTYYDCISSFSVMDYDHVNIDDTLNEVRSLTYRMFDEFSVKNAPQTPMETSSTENQEQFVGDRILSELVNKQNSSMAFELELYLSTSFGFTEADYKMRFDVLEWWKQKSEAFPTLAKIAKEVLVTSTSVSGGKEDQVFTVDGIVLDERRSEIGMGSNFSLVELQTLAGDWVKASYRDQEIMVNEFYDPYVDSDEESA